MQMRGKKLVLLTSAVVGLPLLIASYLNKETLPASPPPVMEVVKKLPDNPYMTDLLFEYEETILKMMEESGVPGAAIAIVKDTTVLYAKGLGVKSINSSDSVDLHTIFRIGSVSKCFAAVLTAMLVHDGVLDWDDPVVKYLPDFKLKSPEQTQLLTIRHVLSHTTGLPYHTYTTLIEDGVELKPMLERLQDINVGQVGAKYSYQNVAFSLIGEVVQAATGKTYEALLEEKLFAPLQMIHTASSFEHISHSRNVARPHLMKKREWREIPVSDKYYNAVPAGGIHASIADMSQWLQALLGNRPDVIPTGSLEEIFTPVITASSKNRSYRLVDRIQENYYALGWRVLYFPQDTIIYHGGYVNGYRSEVAIHPKHKLGICILANAPGEVTDTGIPIFLSRFLTLQDSIRQWDDNLKRLLARRSESL